MNFAIWRRDELLARIMLARWAVKHWVPETALRQAEQVLAIQPTSSDAM